MDSTQELNETSPAQPVAVTPKKRRRRKKKSEVSTEEVLTAEKVVAPPVVAVAPVAKIKKPRLPSSYNNYVKQAMLNPKVKSLPHRQKFAEIGRLWKLEKAKTAK